MSIYDAHYGYLKDPQKEGQAPAQDAPADKGSGWHPEILHSMEALIMARSLIEDIKSERCMFGNDKEQAHLVEWLQKNMACKQSAAASATQILGPLLQLVVSAEHSIPSTPMWRALRMPLRPPST